MTGRLGGMDCIFCAIVAEQAPASRLEETDLTLAFLDIRPATPGHALVIPKRHAANLAELEPEEGAAMFRGAQRVAAAVRASVVPCDGVNLFLADGEIAGQEVFHAHLHVIPRTPGDGVTVGAEFDHPDRELLEKQAAELRGRLTG